MKRQFLLPLILCCLLLAGCKKSQAPAPQPTETAPAETFPSLYDPEAPIEQETNGAVLACPLDVEDAYGLKTMGGRILILSGTEKTTLSVISGDTYRVTARITLDFFLDAQDPSLGTDREGLCFYNPESREVLVLDTALNEVQRIAAPQDLTGSPILSADGSTLYYATPNAIRGWDLDTGVRRLIKESTAPGQRLSGLHMGDTVLEYRLPEEGRTLLISALDGRLLWETDQPMTLRTAGSRWYLSRTVGMQQHLLFGEEEASLLTPPDLQNGIFLENLHGAITRSGDTLSYYNLSAGTCSCELELPGSTVIEDSPEGWIYLLNDNILYRWDVHSAPREGSEKCTGPYVPADLSLYRQLADSIGSRYGIRILVGQEAAEASPWDYDFTPETLESVTLRQLELLDGWLGDYPGEVWEKFPFSSLTICLVREITGGRESGSIETANGLQFFDGTDAYLALAVGPKSNQALYHELFHVMETRLLTYSTAFDRWDTLNPKGFDYAYSYTQGIQNPEYARGEDRAFIDTYSMTFPKEDRARIMEYAMAPGNEALFRSPALQAKLSALCQGLREAYGLEKSEDTFRWEQYLERE